MLLLAHVGHWTVSLIYLLPFVAVAIWLIWDRLRNQPGDASPERVDER
jgi:hypothetical protein